MEFMSFLDPLNAITFFTYSNIISSLEPYPLQTSPELKFGFDWDPLLVISSQKSERTVDHSVGLVTSRRTINRQRTSLRTSLYHLLTESTFGKSIFIPYS